MQPVPTVKELARDPSRARGLSPTVIAALLAKFGADLAELSSAQNALAAALLDSKQAPHATADADDRMMTADEAAVVLHHDRRWLYRHAADLPFVRRVSRKSFLCSEIGLRKWLAAQRA
jgi:hypothetical protein